MSSYENYISNVKYIKIATGFIYIYAKNILVHILFDLLYLLKMFPVSSRNYTLIALNFIIIEKIGDIGGFSDYCW
jgi:hypothetical protein